MEYNLRVTDLPLVLETCMLIEQFKYKNISKVKLTAVQIKLIDNVNNVLPPEFHLRLSARGDAIQPTVHMKILAHIIKKHAPELVNNMVTAKDVIAKNIF